MSARVVVFAKAPVPGSAKTRLIPALGAEGAAALAREMLERTLTAALAAGLDSVELCVDPAPQDPAWAGVSLPAGLVLSAQGTGDLGQRMARAAQRALAATERVLLIGTDCVEMTPALLRGATRALDSADGFMHATADGGYALLGLRRFDRSLFEDIAWSSSAVADQTRARFAALGWKLGEGERLHDVDLPADLLLWRARA
ncbi:MAG: TIGR04282 family arsenosugar biosynthesis glycosyltransferase [Zoogloeaceae bacterium]|nr:TIGR04282 family arsenosugar biosynthesis glycosyltransferase [Zoogloeaceae bacterium]